MGQEPGEAGLSIRDVIDSAAGKWPDILRRYGIPDLALTGRHGPCPICGGKDRFRFDNKEGTGSYFCSQCGAGYGLDLLTAIAKRGKADIAREIEPILGKISPAPWTPARDPGKRIGWITKNLVHANQVPEVLAYLRGRGLKPSSDTFAMPSVRYWEGRSAVGDFPAMVTRFCSPGGDLITYHLTHIKDGKKAPVESPKKVLPPLAKLDGGAIRLTRIYPHIGIAEGVETALAVMHRFRIPCWAAYSAAMMVKFQPPEGVDAVTIYSDNDANFTGQNAAYSLAQRLAGKYRTNVRVPESVGDFADETLKKTP